MEPMEGGLNKFMEEMEIGRKWCKHFMLGKLVGLHMKDLTTTRRTPWMRSYMVKPWLEANKGPEWAPFQFIVVSMISDCLWLQRLTETERQDIPKVILD